MIKFNVATVEELNGIENAAIDYPSYEDISDEYANAVDDKNKSK